MGNAVYSPLPALHDLGARGTAYTILQRKHLHFVSMLRPFAQWSSSSAIQCHRFDAVGAGMAVPPKPTRLSACNDGLSFAVHDNAGRQHYNCLSVCLGQLYQARGVQIVL